MGAEKPKCIPNYKPSTNALAGKTEGTSYSWEVRSFHPRFKGADGARKCILFSCKADLIQCSNNTHPQKNSKQRKSLEMERMKNRTQAIKDDDTKLMDVEQLELIHNKIKLGVLKIDTVQPSLSCNWLTPFIIQHYSWTLHPCFIPT